MIVRQITNDIRQAKKAVILIGARQVGKTTLLKEIISRLGETSLWLNCDQNEVRETLSNISLTDLRLLIGNAKHIVIDEAQRVRNIGLTLKLITDNMPDIKLLVTGSSALELRNETDEALTGRKESFYLYPISTHELYTSNGLITTKEFLTKRLIYGSYPAVITSNNPIAELMELADSYLYKDVLSLEGLRKPAVLEKLLMAVALQVGSEVSLNELSKTVGIDRKTVEKYLDILTKCQIIFTLPSFSRNIRTELTKSKKIYFYDNGIRNAILKNFASIEARTDIGALWENFFVSERIKYNHYNHRYVNSYFWRTTEKQEIDYIEESNGELHLFEMKWNPSKAKTKFPNSFINTYSPTKAEIITPENYLHHLITI